MGEPLFQQVTIVGTGLLGGSAGLALRRGGLAKRVVGVGRREATLREAHRAGCVDTVTTDLAEGVRGSDLVVLATPLGVLPETLERLAAADPGEATVTDVGSTKGSVVAAAIRALPAPERFVGAHPMAGSERTGPQSARADLFQDKPVVLTPAERTSESAVATAERFWSRLGMRPRRLGAAEHDRLVAAVSHVPHAAAALLIRLASHSGGLPIASTGFRDATRLASADPELWTDIFLDNRSAILDAMAQCEEGLTTLRRALADHDRQAVYQLFQSAKAERDGWVRRSDDGD